MKTFEVVLVHPTEPKTVRLPPLALAPTQISDAKFLIEGVRTAYGVESVVLKRLGGRRGADRRFEFYRYALRALSPELTVGLAWAEGADAEEVLGQAESVKQDQPWANPAWWPQMVRWVGEACAEAGLPKVAKMAQVRAWDLSAVVAARLEGGEVVYYKGVPRAFAAEPALTAWLAKILPGRGPGVIAVDQARRCMLLRACGGTRLDTLPDLATWERALRDYAAIQQSCTPHVDHLASLGLPRRPLDWLPGAWARLVSDKGCLQPGSHADLTDAEIVSLRAADGPCVAEWVARLATLGIPDTLEHGDFHSLNTFVSAAGTTVIDWTDAAVAHPFFSLACFLRSLRFVPALNDRADALETLATAYSSCWTTHAPREALTRALPTVIRLGAVFQAVHYRERINPLVDKNEEVYAAVPAYVSDVLTAGR